MWPCEEPVCTANQEPGQRLQDYLLCFVVDLPTGDIGAADNDDAVLSCSMALTFLRCSNIMLVSACLGACGHGAVPEG